MVPPDDPPFEHWPRKGDHLFLDSGHRVDAQLATLDSERLYRMKKGFKISADLLVAQSESDPHERDNLVWPIVFCYRQYLELALKDMIAVYGSRIDSKIKPNWNNHKLAPLWVSYKAIIADTLEAIGVDDLTEVGAIEACIAEFDQVDAGSYTFRYPTDTKGRPTAIPLSSIDLLHFKEVTEGISLYLDATETVLSEHLDATPDRQLE